MSEFRGDPSGSDCTYGRYGKAKFAGSAGYSTGSGNAKGGGVASISATNFILNGVINVNGNKGNHTKGGGSGGGVHLDVSTLSGIGRVESIGATYYSNGSWHTGGGGRISVYVDDRSGFTGNFIAKSDTTGNVSGAGSVYIKESAQTFGHLLINNGGRAAPANSTPIRTVGRHNIVDVYEATAGVWKVVVDGNSWKSNDADLQWGIDGIDVDLDASEDVSTHYSIVANSTNVLTIHTNDNLLGYLGNELVGVHTFETVNVTGGAALTLDKDRLVVRDLANSSVGVNSQLSIGFLTQDLIELAGNGGGKLELRTTPSLADLDLSNLSGSSLVFNDLVSINNLTVGSGKVYFNGGLSVAGNISINNAATVTALVVSTNSLTVDAATLITEFITTNNNVNVINAAKITVPTATSSPKRLYKLNLTSGGVVTVDSTSNIDLNGKGYPSNLWAGPNFVDDQNRYACYGGKRSNTGADCTYGRYEEAKFAGSAGYHGSGSSNGYGGGAVSINAASLVLEGNILVNGRKGHSSYGGGAGGGVHLDVASLSGAGRVESIGATYYANGSNHTAGGGRISVYVNDRSAFTGSLIAKSDVTGKVAGAGTVYIKESAQAYGHLMIDNGGRTARTSSTPLRSVGRHTIKDIYKTIAGVWKVEVTGNPWKESDSNLQWGLEGISVDLDATETSNPHYVITSNTTNTLTIQTNDDLSALEGNELVGVHTFQTVNVIDGASASFGSDRVVILDEANSTLDIDAALHVGLKHVASLNYTSNGRVDADELVVDGDVIVDGVQLTLNVKNPIKIGGDLKLLNGATLTVNNSSTNKISRLDLIVTGVVTIDATSTIDLNGKGYPANLWSGPDFNKSRYSCYGGKRSNTGTDCTYGRYEEARFAGSAGYAQSTGNGYGGGVLSLKANSLTLDGSIQVNGRKGHSSYGGGAGGGVHLDVATLSGAGRVESIGATYYANGSWHTGGGGRISVYVDERTGFTGNLIAKSDVTGRVAGAGTVYIKESAQTYGHLSVDNGGRTAAANSTPLRSVGRHLITDVYQITTNVWKVEVAGSPWKSSNASLQWGLDGIDVDLDASETSSPLYKIVSNTTNTITLQTSDDLSALEGNELVGVHTFQTIHVTGGARTSFGQDVVIIVDRENSLIGAGEILGTGPIYLDSLSVTKDSRIDAEQLAVAGDVTVDGAKLVLSVKDQITINGNLRLINGATLTSPGATSSPKVINKLDIVVTGNITIDATSTIDLNGKGYPANLWSGPDFNQTRYSCYGGKRSNTRSDCTYGRYEEARFAGSAGYYVDSTFTGSGGGVLSLSANGLILDGSIKVNGHKGNSSYGGGAGGGVHLDVATLTGAGRVESIGATYYANGSWHTGGGGRVSVYVDDRSGFTGSFVAKSDSVGRVAGAGTVFIKESAQTYGHLSVDNGGRVAAANSTPLRSVGLHTILNAYETIPGIWNIEVTGTPWKASNNALQWGLNGIDVDLDASETAGKHYAITSNTSNILTLFTTDDLTVFIGKQLVGVHTFNTFAVTNGASAGFSDDRVVIAGNVAVSNDTDGDGLLDVDEIGTHNTDPTLADTDGDNIPDGLEVAMGTSPIDPLSGDISAYTTALIATPSSINTNLSARDEVQNVVITADVTFNSKRYLIDVTDSAKFGTTYTSTDNTVAISLGNGIVDTVNSGSALLQVAFASQQIDVAIDVAVPTTESWSATTTNLIEDTAVASATLNQSTLNGSVEFISLGDLNVTGGGSSSINVKSLIVDGDLIIDASKLVVGIDTPISIGGNLQLINGATLSVSNATTSPKRIYDLNLNVAGTTTVDATSLIDLNAKGYPADNWSGPDFSKDTRRGCHGGIRGNTSAKCTYGRYEKARYSGSAGLYYNSSYLGHGGGLLNLVTPTLELEGVIRANGGRVGWTGQSGGAGGGINIEASTLSGAGTVQTNGGHSIHSSYDAAGGGRISIYVDDRSGFSGSLQSRGSATGKVAGAGTVYVKESAETYGHLYVDNNGRGARASSTPIRSVGRHIIIAAEQVNPGEWRIAVDGNPWKATDANYDWGIDGLDVDLDASETASTHYRIIRNRTSTLTVNTLDDLSGIVGNELIGVHTFQTISVTGGASVTFADDRVEVVDSVNSVIEGNTPLNIGSSQQSAIEQILNANGYISSSTPIQVSSLSYNSSQTATLKAPSLIIDGDFILDGSTMVLAIDGEISVGGNIQLINGATLTVASATSSPKRLYGLNLNVAGNVTIDNTSLVDLNGKGYPSDYWSGPDFSNNTRRSCYGGKRSDTSSDCTYGHYENANYAGSAGQNYNGTSHTAQGGGVLKLNAANLLLEGTVRANGLSGYSTYGGGAGGGININVINLNGAGSVQAYGGGNGWNNRPVGGGGRISVNVTDRSGFTGTLSARGGVRGTNIGGAGTVYVKEVAQTNGHLIVDNGGNTAKGKSTPVRTVGRHIVTGVDEVTPGEWRIEVQGAPWTTSNPTYGWGIHGLSVDLDASETLSPHYVVTQNTVNTITILTNDDLSSSLNSELVGVHAFETINLFNGAQVDFGLDRLIVNDLINSTIGINSSLSVGEIDQSLLELSGSGGGNLILQGTPRLSNLDLSSLGTSKLTFSEPINIDNLTLSSGTLRFNGGLTVAGTLSLVNTNVTALELSAGTLNTDSSTLTTRNISTTGDLQLLNNSTVLVPNASSGSKVVYGLKLAVGGSVTLDATSVIDLNGKGYPADYWSGPDFSNNTRRSCYGGKRSDTTIDCTYGRMNRAKFAGSAGEYYNGTSSAKGGGVLELNAASLLLDGVIQANGVSGDYTYGGGAGGGAHIDVATLRGSGSVQTYGGGNRSNNRAVAGGGRISLNVIDRSAFTGVLRARGGVSGNQKGGAGTVYVKEAAVTDAHLIVDNGGYVAKANSTPMRIVGRHLITGVDEVNTGEWRIEVEGTPWNATDAVNDWGIDGLNVDLDVSENVSTIYKIVKNSDATLTVLTSDDLSAIVGNELVGVHTFETVMIKGGAWVDFGDDRLIINDGVNSSVSNNSTIKYGIYNQSDLVLQNLSGNLVFSQPLNLSSLTISNGSGSGSISTPSFTVSGDVSISGLSSFNIISDDQSLDIGGSFTLDSSILNLKKHTVVNVMGNMSMLNSSKINIPNANSSSKLINKLDIFVAGTMTIDATSTVDLNGKGYPSSYWSGPDFVDSNANRWGCYGGKRQNTSVDCTYGRYEDAKFAGSAGQNYNSANPGHGGGVFDLSASNLVLDGTIQANGLNGYHDNGGGAGGGIHLAVTNFSGTGLVSANGGGNYWNNRPGAGGGRISIETTDRTGYTGQLQARGNRNSNYVAGAGTVYVKLANETYGHLTIDNGGFTAAAGSTPIRSVGEHEITDAQLVGFDTWVISVAGTPWKATDKSLGWGIDGIDVDFDASEDVSLHYKIISNTENTLTVTTSDNLLGVVGNNLVGVHTFETFIEGAGASVSFSNDRVIQFQ